MTYSDYFKNACDGDFRSLARLITLVENHSGEIDLLLKSIDATTTCKVIGITGPPGAGKSTLTDALIEQLVRLKKRVAVLCVDPSSPFSTGALLGDRIRMQNWYREPLVYIRSLSSRGALGGLGTNTIEITELLKSVGFDYIIVETVGVGQSEVDIAALADITTVVLVPESGDDIQTMKSGLLEIADIFIINKSDRPGALKIKTGLISAMEILPIDKRIPVIETTATEGTGIDTWLEQLIRWEPHQYSEKKIWMLAEKAWQLIARKKMRFVDKEELADRFRKHSGQINLYRIVDAYIELKN
jgi:LAO/AO transport system kinase